MLQDRGRMVIIPTTPCLELEILKNLCNIAIFGTNPDNIRTILMTTIYVKEPSC